MAPPCSRRNRKRPKRRFTSQTLAPFDPTSLPFDPWILAFDLLSLLILPTNVYRICFVLLGIEIGRYVL